MIETLTGRLCEGLTSADSGKPTGARTPADALEAIQRMSDLDRDVQESTECPTCGRDDFKTPQGMKTHHTQVHGESIAGVERTCDWCGDTYRIRASRADRPFCSSTCFGEWRAEVMVGENCPGHKEKVTLECEWCGSDFETFPSRESIRRFCSFDCKGEWQSENMAGEQHPQWKGGYETNRGTNWPKLRGQTLAANDYQCQGCGRLDEDHRAEHGAGLDVHHIQPVTEFDEPADADTVDNLVPLCRDCHREWEGIPIRPKSE